MGRSASATSWSPVCYTEPAKIFPAAGEWGCVMGAILTWLKLSV
jgi:hypothetical protein